MDGAASHVLFLLLKNKKDVQYLKEKAISNSFILLPEFAVSAALVSRDERKGAMVVDINGRDRVRREEVVEEREQLRVESGEWRVKRAFRVRRSHREYDNAIAFASGDSAQDCALSSLGF